MRTFLLCLVFSLFFCPLANSQNYIGLHKNEIIDSMKVSHRNFKINRDVVNKTYHYIKFEDKITEQTVLFFLSDTDHCTLIRWMGDYSNINDMVKRLNTNYHKAGKNQWHYSHEGKEYAISLDEGEWYFTVTFRPKNK
jgi:hypothetical protein